MKARAPGKVVLSGAYAVLSGAPAIVTAVSRYAVADTEREAPRVTPEVSAALRGRRAPWFDAAELRDDGEKLGLGSSAAILVACLAALELQVAGPLDDAELGERVLPAALEAHARAQQGGSGIDVAASALGGTLIATRAPDLRTEPVALPDGLSFEVWASGVPAVTRDLVARVAALGRADARRHDALMGKQAEAARAAASALRRGDLDAFVSALDAQHHALRALGNAAGAPIVTDAVARLAELARQLGGTVLPSGAGGGDVAVFVARQPPTKALRELSIALNHTPVALALHARGVHAVD